jgi:hypothetical protein
VKEGERDNEQQKYFIYGEKKILSHIFFPFLPSAVVSPTMQKSIIQQKSWWDLPKREG